MVNQYCAHSFARNWQLPFLNQRKGENDRRKYFMINLHERILTCMNPDLNKLCESLPFFFLSSLISMVEWKDYFRFIIKFSTLTSSVRSYHFFFLSCLIQRKTYFLACPSIAIAQRVSVSVYSPSKSVGWGHELRLFLIPSDRCLCISTSFNTTDTPPPAVGTTSPWLKKYIYYSLGLIGGNFVKIRKISR